MVEDPVAASTQIGKLLVVLSLLHKGQQIDQNQKSQLKVMAIHEDPALLGALEAFEVDNDLFELADTLRETLNTRNSSQQHF